MSQEEEETKRQSEATSEREDTTSINSPAASGSLTSTSHAETDNKDATDTNPQQQQDNEEAGDEPPSNNNNNNSNSKIQHRDSLTTTEPSSPPRRRSYSFVEPPPPFRALSDHARSDMHARLRAFESRRRSAYTAKLESSSLYWRSFRDLLQASVQETARAERLVVGTARAHQQYSAMMRASYQDGLLDDKGHIVLDPKRQAKLVEQRNGGVAGVAGGKDANMHATTVVSSLEQQQQQPQPQRIMTLEDSKRQHMLTTLIESQLVLSEKFGENANHLEQEIASEITSLRQSLSTQVDSIQFLGNAILSELEQTEAEVSKAWEAYFSVASKVGGGLSSTSSFSSSASLGPSSMNAVDDACRDVWVVEMQYRVSVAYQSAAWDKGSSELSTLFASMKDTECKRRIDLREYLVAFVQRQERLYHSLPEVYTPVLRDLVGRDMDRNSIEEKVQATIRRRAETLQREEAKSKPSQKRGSGLPSVVTKEIQEKGKFTLESPLMSELLCKAKVIEKKGGGMISGWRTTLAIVTADAYLHLFELPASSPVNNGSAPEVAFQAMIPSVKVPTADTIKAGKINFVKGWCDWLVPSESLSLVNCAITTGLNDPHGSAFEIAERTLSSGAKKMLGQKTTTRRITLRTITSKEAEDWIAALKAQKYPKPPEATLQT